jgi:uncharacterized membrane protein
MGASPRLLGASADWRRGALMVVAVAGVALAAYLTYVHYRPEALVCTASGGCETVQKSDYATIIGIPVALLGLVMWSLVAVLTALDGPLTRAATATIGLASVAFSAYLVILQLIVIDAVCVWCMINDVVLVPLLAVLAMWRLRLDLRAGAYH